MPGPRVPTDVLKATGRKHLSKKEETQRRAGEVQVEKPKRIIRPKWLPEALHKDFGNIAGKLIAAGIYTELDADTLGRYLVAHHHWLQATQEVSRALAAKKLEESDSWGRVQERYFKQARNCANDLGLTVTSRCRLVVPNADAGQEENNDFLRLIRGGTAANG